MNKFIASILLITASSVYAQQIDYTLKCPYGRALSAARLTNARAMTDLVEGYPSAWITDYKSTAILVEHDGNERNAAGRDINLSAAQQSLLTAATVGDRVTIRLDYLKNNPVTQAKQVDHLEYAFTVVPEITAASTSADGSFKQYFSGLLKQLPKYDDKVSTIASLSFFVDEDGKVTGATVAASSGDAKIDGLLLNAVRSMPKWNPGQDRKGKRYRQAFLFEVVNAGC